MKTKIDDAYKQLACAILNTILDDARKPEKLNDVIESIEDSRLSLFCSIAEVRKVDFLNAVFDIIEEND